MSINLCFVWNAKADRQWAEKFTVCRGLSRFFGFVCCRQYNLSGYFDLDRVSLDIINGGGEFPLRFCILPSLCVLFVFSSFEPFCEVPSFRHF